MSDQRILRVKADIERAKREKTGIQALLKELDGRLSSAGTRTKKLQDERRKLCIKNADNHDQQEALQDEIYALKDALYEIKCKHHLLNHKTPEDEKDLARMNKELAAMDEEIRTQTRKIEKQEKALEDQRLETNNDYSDIQKKTTEIYNHRTSVHRDQRDKATQQRQLSQEEDRIKALTKELAVLESEAKEQAKASSSSSSNQAAATAVAVSATAATSSGGLGELLGPGKLAVLNLFPQGGDEDKFISRDSPDGPIKATKLKAKGGTFSVNGVSFKYSRQADTKQVVISEVTFEGGGKAQFVVY